jgi:hypothetical protein
MHQLAVHIGELALAVWPAVRQELGRPLAPPRRRRQGAEIKPAG